MSVLYILIDTVISCYIGLFVLFITEVSYLLYSKGNMLLIDFHFMFLYASVDLLWL